MAEVSVKDKIEYTVAIVNDFAKKYSLSTTRDLATYLMRDFSFTVEQALRAVYNTELYQKLCDPKTRLYFQSSFYVYDNLKTEIKTGKLQ